MRKIAIIGSGWLSIPLAKSLLQDGHHVCLTTRSVLKRQELRAAGYRAEIYDLGTPLTLAISQADILIIAITSKEPALFQNLLDQILRSHIRHVIFVSSTSVYPFTGSLVDENITTIDSALSQIERLFQVKIGQKTTILRFAGLVGDRRHPGMFFRNKVCKTPKAHVNVIHLQDCVGIVQYILEKEIFGEVINGCADTHPLKDEFYTHYAQQIGLSVPEFEYTSQSPTKIVSNVKIKELGYSFRHPDVMQLPEMELQQAHE